VIAQQSLLPTLPIGSRWSVNGANVWELVRIDGPDYVLRFVSGPVMPNGYVVGDEIRIEQNWFVVRGALGKTVPGAVREVVA
jgi:hypothetical protein